MHSVFLSLPWTSALGAGLLLAALWPSAPAWAQRPAASSGPAAPANANASAQALAACAGLLRRPATQRSLQLLRLQLQAQGMQLQLQGCPFVHVPPAGLQQVLEVRALVVHAEVAADWVRGPLADGEQVDMGADVPPQPAQTPYWPAPEAGDGPPETDDLVEPPTCDVGCDAEDVSPDVAFNRDWLAQLMLRHGFQVVPGHWWAFVPAAGKVRSPAMPGRQP